MLKISDKSYIVDECVNDYDFALTFDDGPNDMTISHLNYFKNKGIKVTFFFIVNRLLNRKSAKVVKRAKDEGHVVAIHNYFHDSVMKDLKGKSDEEIKKYFKRSTSLFKNKIKVIPRFFRPPYGDIDEKLAKRITKLTGLRIILWNLDTKDWLHIQKGHNPNKIVKKFLSELEKDYYSYISLQHDKGTDLKGDLKRLDIIIDKIKKSGYNLVTLNECLNEKAYFE